MDIFRIFRQWKMINDFLVELALIEWKRADGEMQFASFLIFVYYLVNR